MAKHAGRVALKGVGSLFVAWYTLALLVFLQQERKVGWPKFKKQLGFMLYGASLFGGAAMVQPLVLVVYLLKGHAAARKVAHQCQCAVHRCMLGLFFCTPQFEGLCNLPPPEEGCIYVGNHTSSIDMSVPLCLPGSPHICAVAKKSIFVVPGMGVLVGLAGGIFIDRSAPGGAMASLVQTGKKRLASGLSIGIFPQGTRKVIHPGKPVNQFKKGAFVLADASRARIVPISYLYPMDFMSTNTSLKLVIHPPVSPKGDGDVEGLMREVENIVMKPVLNALQIADK